jgi:hypothetical protein
MRKSIYLAKKQNFANQYFTAVVSTNSVELFLKISQVSFKEDIVKIRHYLLLYNTVAPFKKSFYITDCSSITEPEPNGAYFGIGPWLGSSSSKYCDYYR